MTINCGKITKETKELMFSLIDKAEKRRREHSVYLCEDKNGNIVHSNFCIGSLIRYPDEDSKNSKISASVSVKKLATCRCPIGTRTIGNFHTLPFGTLRPSKTDIVSIVSEGHSSICIGIRSNEWIEKINGVRDIDKISCFDIKDEELLRLGNEAQELAQKGNIDEAKSRVIPIMFDRIKNVSFGHLLKTKCKMSITRL